MESLEEKIDKLSSVVNSFNDRITHVEANIDKITESVNDIDVNAKEARAVADEATHKLNSKLGPPSQGYSPPSQGYANDSSYTFGKTHVDQSKSSSSVYEGQKKLYGLNVTPSVQEDGAAVVQREFETIKDGLNKVKLPSELKVFHSATGIKGDSKAAYNILKQAATYQETAAKWLASHVSDENRNSRGKFELSDDSLQELFTIFLAHANCLRSEFTSLLVASSTNQETQQFFRLFERNPAAFSQRELVHLERAVELAGMSSKLSQRGRGRGSGFYNRGRGGFNRGGRWNYEKTFQNKGIPQQRRQGAASQFETE